MARTDMAPARKEFPQWDAQNPAGSLNGTYEYVKGQAVEAIDWYYQAKRAKSWWSSTLRLLTILASAAGGLIPIVATVVTDDTIKRLRWGQYGYVSFGMAAFFLAADRFSGSSTGWMRYMTTAMALETLLEELRFDWTRMVADAKGTPDAQKALERLRTFTLASRSLVEKETQAWVTEFKDSMAAIEQQTKQAWDAAREASRKDAEALDAARKEAKKEADAQKEGAVVIEVTHPSALPDGYDVEVDGRPFRQKVSGPSCGIAHLLPGLHEVAIGATVGGKRLVASVVVPVKASEVTTVPIALEVPAASLTPGGSPLNPLAPPAIRPSQHP